MFLFEALLAEAEVEKTPGQLSKPFIQRSSTWSGGHDADK